MTLAEKKEQLLQQLSGLGDAQERFAFLVARGRNQPSLDASEKYDRFKIRGCLANLWLVPSWRDGRCYYRADADSVIVKAIAGLLCDFYSGHPPEEILALDPSFLRQVGITQHLTPNRRNALSRVWEQIRGFAMAQAPMSPAPSSNPHPS